MRLYHKNPRQITDEQFGDLKQWLEELGDLGGIVHNIPTDEVISGNQRCRAIDINRCEIVLEEEYDEPDAQGTVAWGYVIWKGHRYSYRAVVWDQETCEKANIVANKAGGKWDWDILASWGKEEMLLEWGFTEEELQFIAPPAPPPPDPGSQDAIADELQEKWQCELGQIWEIPSHNGGYHRLMCGDATNTGQVRQLMGGKRADMIFIDPPYLMEYEGPMRKGGWHGQRHSVMIGDKMSREEGDLFLSQMAAIIKRHCKGAFYICFHRLKLDRIMNALSANDLRWRAVIVWYKGSLNLSGADYKSAYEPILYGWNEEHVWHGTLGEMDVIELSAVAQDQDAEVITVSGSSTIIRLGDHFYMVQRLEDPPTAFIDAGDSARFAFYDEQESDVWEVRKSQVNDLHPTMKPPEIVRRAITNSSAQGDDVADWFCGSGTTLVVCEQEGRQGYGMELDPKYVAVALDRLAGMGLEPVLISG